MCCLETSDQSTKRPEVSPGLLSTFKSWSRPSRSALCLYRMWSLWIVSLQNVFFFDLTVEEPSIKQHLTSLQYLISGECVFFRSTGEKAIPPVRYVLLRVYSTAVANIQFVIKYPEGSHQLPWGLPCNTPIISGTCGTPSSRQTAVWLRLKLGRSQSTPKIFFPLVKLIILMIVHLLLQKQRKTPCHIPIKVQTFCGKEESWWEKIENV